MLATGTDSERIVPMLLRVMEVLKTRSVAAAGSVAIDQLEARDGSPRLLV